MYKEEKIFGPFTFKQFVHVVGGTGVTYVLWKQVGGDIAIGGIILVAIITVVLIVRSNPQVIKKEDLRNYLQEKRFKTGETEYKNWMRKRTASVAAQIATRKERGLTPDKKLEDVLRVLESES